MTPLLVIRMGNRFHGVNDLAIDNIRSVNPQLLMGYPRKSLGLTWKHIKPNVGLYYLHANRSIFDYALEDTPYFRSRGIHP